MRIQRASRARSSFGRYRLIPASRMTCDQHVQAKPRSQGRYNTFAPGPTPMTGNWQLSGIIDLHWITSPGLDRLRAALGMPHPVRRLFTDADAPPHAGVLSGALKLPAAAAE